MLPILYIFLKNLFGKTVIASCGTILFAFDFMHYVQTRIATIDTYGVIFILISYFFMYRYITEDPEAPFQKTIVPLALSGLFFGIGSASKWIVIYAGAGLLLLYAIRLIWCFKYYKENEKQGFLGFLLSTLLCTFTFYIIIPAAIYCLSYIGNGRAAGMTIKGGMLWDPRYYQMIWDNQKFMFHYHSTLVATHAYSSVWWQWILDARPILYYREVSGGLKSSFASFGNPIVWWGGFLAMIAMVYRVIKFRDFKALFILIGYMAQFAPWLFITRVVFIYHYFPCVLFMCMALAHVLDTIWERAQGQYKLAVYGFTGSSVLLFILFFPVLNGVPVSEFYTKYFLRWIPYAWPF
jgi:dolichyl-phosphate-mannose--protein O-mannosyl transferase